MAPLASGTKRSFADDFLEDEEVEQEHERRSRQIRQRHRLEKKLDDERARLRIKEDRRLEYEQRLEDPMPPWHPDENRLDLKPQARIRISSGGVCFGYQTDIEVAQSENLRSVYEACDDELNKNHNNGQVCPPNNITVRNGVWMAFPIHSSGRGVGWLLCHEDYDSVGECRYILYNSVSPVFGGASIERSSISSNGSGAENFHPFGILQQNLCKCREQQSCLVGEMYQMQTDTINRGALHFEEYSNQDNAFRMVHLYEYTFARIRFEGSCARSFLFYGDTLEEAYFGCFYKNKNLVPNPLKYPLGSRFQPCGWPIYHPIHDLPQHYDNPEQRKITDFFK